MAFEYDVYFHACCKVPLILVAGATGYYIYIVIRLVYGIVKTKMIKDYVTLIIVYGCMLLFFMLKQCIII